MKKVLITDKIHEVCVNSFESAGFEVAYNTDLKPEELLKVIHEFNILIVRSATKVTAEIINSADNLEIIGRAGTGVDNIDLKAATRKGVIVMNTPGGNTISAAELAFAHIMALCRMLPQADKSMKEGRWDRKLFYGTELFGKNLGVIGLGQIGKEVAVRAKAFNMNILAYDPVASKDWAIENEVKLGELDELLAESDIITLHVPMNEHTRNLISEASISKMKDGVKIVNCARGGIVNESDVLNALNSGKISGVSLDVFEQEPPDCKELIDHKNSICTPHLGASTKDALEKVAKQISDQIMQYFSKGILAGSINADAIMYLSNKDLAPHINLAESIGRLLQKLAGDNLAYNLELSGTLLQKHSELINLGLLKGLLGERFSTPVNFINAKSLADDAGIKSSVTESSDDDHYNNLITVKFKSDEASRRISGTVMNDKPRIVAIDDYTIEFEPEGHLIFYYNIDKPGVLSKVSKILADNNINIAGLSLGRKDKGKEALTIVNVDEVINEKILSETSSIEEINGVNYIKI